MPEDTAAGENEVVEKRGRGRAKGDKASKPATPKRKAAEDVTGDAEAGDAPAPVKRGRGRPPKAGGPAKKKAAKVPGRGRGRPAKKAAPKEDADDDEEESDE